MSGVAAGARGRDVQGVRPPGREHARGDTVDARIAHAGEGVPVERPGDPAASSASHRRQLRRRLSATGAARAGPRLTGEMPRMPTTSSLTVLPAGFADLEAFAGFALPTERERYAKRIESSMAELQAFYDAAVPRLEAAMTYLDQFPLDALADDAKRLLWLYSRSSRCRSPWRCGANRACPTAARRASTR